MGDFSIGEIHVQNSDRFRSSGGESSRHLLLWSKNELQLHWGAKVTVYRRSPLVELIAEVRWPTEMESVYNAAAPGTAIPFTPEHFAESEQLFSLFAEKIDPLGFRYSERLTPPGAPGLPGSVSVRYRTKPTGGPVLQLGIGVMTANATPDQYEGWESFALLLTRAIEALAASRSPKENEVSFALVSLRYINAFDSRFWPDETAADFITSKLKFRVEIPSKLEAHIQQGARPRANVQMQVPLGENATFGLTVGEGQVNAVDAALLDMNVRYTNVAVDEAMAAFHAAHGIASTVFEEMIDSVRAIMEPGGE